MIRVLITVVRLAITWGVTVLLSQLLSQSSVDVPALQAEVTRAWEVVVDAETAHATTVLAAKVSARESAVAWDSATFHVKDVEDWVALAEKEALERVSKAEAENATVLATASKDTEGLARKVTLLEDELAAEHWAQEMSQREHWACFEELTLLQTWDSVLCHAIVGPPWAKYLSEGMRLAALHHTEMAGELTMFWAVVSSAAQSVLGCSPSNTTRAVVVGELVAEFQ
jgi:hypothetical protein